MKPEVLDKILNLGATSDFLITSEEAAYITGLSVEAVRGYGRDRRLTVIQSKGRNLYRIKEVCKFAAQHLYPGPGNSKIIQFPKVEKKPFPECSREEYETHVMAFADIMEAVRSRKQ